MHASRWARVLEAFAVALLVGCGGGGGGGGPDGPGGPDDPGPSMPQADCGAASPRSTGTTTYYCSCGTGKVSGCVEGDDDKNPGTKELPKKSFSNAIARFNAMAAGDTVALCRGGAWDGVDGNQITNTRCTSDAPCDLRDYAPSWGAGTDNPRPRINAVSGATVLAFWNDTMGGFRIWNLDIREAVEHKGDGIVQVLNDLHDTDFCGNSFTGAWLSMNFAPTGRYDSHLSVRNSQFRSTQFTGFIGGAPGIAITGNDFQDNGLGADESRHSVYLISECPFSGYTPHCTGNEFGYPHDAESSSTYTFSNNQIRTGSSCGGVMLVVHGAFVNSHLVAENNLIETTSTNPHCYGIELSGGNSGAEFHDMVFSRNRVKVAPGASGIEVDCCEDCTVTDNIVSGGGTLSVSTAECTPGYFAEASGTYQNNTVHGGGFVIGEHGAGPYDLDSNAVWVSSGTCYVTTQLGRNGGNYCSTGSPSATTLWVDPDAATFAEADFTPAPGSPLIGHGDATHHSPRAIGSPTWSPTDTGKARSGRIDAGALVAP